VSRILITGAASGIGAAAVESFTGRGHTVIVIDVNAHGEIIALDVGDEQGWADLVQDVAPLDSLVNCAGVRRRTLLLEVSAAEWDAVLRVNLTGTFLGVQAFARQCVDRKRPGAIANIASTTAFAAVEGQPHYVASKAGVSMLTRAAARELAIHGIRDNAIAPEPTETPMLNQRLDIPGQREWLTSMVPLGRLAQVEDIVAAMRYLLSEDAAFVTGVTLPVDGGRCSPSGRGDDADQPTHKESLIVTLHIRVDHELCISSGKCVGDEPEVFAFDDNELAYVATAEHQMDRARVLRVAQNCPSQAIIVHDEHGDVIAV